MVLLLALLLTAILTPSIIWAAHRLQLIDVPNHRSSHIAPVPRGGGIAVAGGVAVATLVSSDINRAVTTMAIGALLLGAVGLADDRFNLPALPRLAAQVLVPLVVAALVVDRSGVALLGAALVAVVATVGYVNAFNFMDGVNGISATQAAIAAAVLGLLADDVGQRSIRVACLALCGASIGFLPFNAVRSHIFLGDVGSYFIGAWLAGTALLVVDAGAPPLVVVAPFLLYLADTSTVLVRRARRGASLLEAHREHAYQRLHQLGWSHLSVTLLTAAVSVVCSAAMFSVHTRGMTAQLSAFAACLCVVGGYLAVPGALRRRRSVGVA